MWRRGGGGTHLGERIAIYKTSRAAESNGAVHIHAISVGESLLALKLIRAWRSRMPDQRFVLATGTSTGHAVASAAAIPGLRVTYAPIDFPSMVSRYLKRFKPAQIILIEAELWPSLLVACRQRNIPISLVNARMSPQSVRRYQRFTALTRPLLAMLEAVAIQEPEHAAMWQNLGVDLQRIHYTGSLKFDPSGGEPPVKRAEFQDMLDYFGQPRPVIIAASTHAGEDAWIAAAIGRAVPLALPVIVPRHAERRATVANELEQAGFTVFTRSKFHDLAKLPRPAEGRHVLLIDSTGELRDWTAHADLVIIGKSFFATGGQNPTEAILTNKPIIFGPHMDNFEPLASQLVTAHGALRVVDANELVTAISTALEPSTAASMTHNAAQVLIRHDGATQRIIDLVTTISTTRK